MKINRKGKKRPNINCLSASGEPPLLVPLSFISSIWLAGTSSVNKKEIPQETRGFH
jgi:hypothetical protein